MRPLNAIGAVSAEIGPGGCRATMTTYRWVKQVDKYAQETEHGVMLGAPFHARNFRSAEVRGTFITYDLPVLR